MIGRTIDALAIANEAGVDLLVVSGKLDDVRELCRSARIPVLVIPDAAPPTTRYPRFERLIVGLDGSADAEAALPIAVRLLREGAKLTLLAVPDGEASATLPGYVESVRGDARVPSEASTQP